jgi:hypothetical protein
MVCAGYTKIWELEPGELVRLDDARGTTLRVTRGTLWITLEHDIRDIVLTAGDAFTIDRGGLTVVEAQGRATVCVLAHHLEDIHVRGPHVPSDRRLAGWLRSLGAAAMGRGWVPYF